MSEDLRVQDESEVPELSPAETPEQPQETPEEALLRAEVRLGGDDPRARAANDALRALARASRSYLIYDPRNNAIRDFLQAVKEGFETYQAEYGGLILEVRPFELVLDGQDIVYLERDRERSLAFKLYRDGVRKLSVHEGVTWHELTQLLGIVSVRYVGIRQNPSEDDMVTLLWKAGFSNIDIEAVEGFVPDEDDSPDAGVSGAPGFNNASSGAAIQHVPLSFDLPEPKLMESSERVSYKPLALNVVDEILSEETSGRLPETILSLTDELLQLVRDPTDPISFEEISFLIRECRDFLLAEDQLDVLLTMFRTLSGYRDEINPDDEDALERVDRLLNGFVDDRAIGKLIDSLPLDTERPPDQFYELLELMPGDPFDVLMDLLQRKRTQNARRFTRTLLEDHLPARQDNMVVVYRTSEGSIAADLLRVLARGAPEAAQQLVAELIRSGSMEVQLEFLKLAEDQSMRQHIRSFLLQLLNAQSEEVRLRTLDLIVAQGERGAFRPVFRIAQQRMKLDISDQELMRLGASLAQIDPAQALEVFTVWCQPQGLLKKLVSQDRPQRCVAIGGLEFLPQEEAAALLKETNWADDELQRAAQRAIRRRRAALQ